MAEKVVAVPQLAWHNPRDLYLTFPATWDVEILNMKGFDLPVLQVSQIRSAISSPVCGPPLREIAAGAGEVAILFDDLTRVTRADRIIPFILEELAWAGVPDSRVRFIAALGCHGALNRMEMVKKLGAEVVARYPVYNHNAFENCVYAGATGSGTPLFVNAEVMNCSLKIGIGAITPHIMTGFGGGGKIVLPGITSLATAEAFHSVEKNAGQRVAGQKGATGMGVFENNPLQEEIQEAVKIVGLDFIVNCLVNFRGDTVAVFAGDPVGAFAAGAAGAKTHYLTPAAGDADVVVANNFAKASEAIVSLFTSCNAVSKNGGDMVLICNTPEGQAPHFLMGAFGKTAAGRLRLQVQVPPRVRRLIVFNKYPEFAARDWFAGQENVIFARTWQEVRSLLEKWHGSRARVAVYPDAAIQYSG